MITSGLPRTVETARIVAPDLEPEAWPDLRELETGRLADIPEDELERAFTHAFRDVVPEDAPLPRAARRSARSSTASCPRSTGCSRRTTGTSCSPSSTAASTARSSPARSPAARTFLGNLEQSPACVNVLDVGDDWIVRAVNVTPYDLAHLEGRSTTMEELWQQFRST